MPPVEAFWSLTMYRATGDGQFFFFDNAVDRYAIGNRTDGLQKDPDGGVTIWMSRADPGPARRSNWLPLPPEGSFAPVFRAYGRGRVLPRGPGKSFDSMLTRTLVAARTKLVRIKTEISNQIRGLMKTFGLVIPAGKGST